MDFIQEYLPQVYYLYNQYHTTLSPYVVPALRFLLLTQSYFYRYLYPTIYPIYTLCNNALHSASSDSPDLFTLGLLATVLLMSIWILDYMRRTIMYWTRLAMKLGFWLAILIAVMWIWKRGVEQSLEDFGWIWGLLAGLGEDGERIGRSRAGAREREARRMAGRRGRTRGGGW